MEDCPQHILTAHDLLVDFIPDPQQVARRRVERGIPRWQIALPVVAMTLFMIGWLAYQPGVEIAHGAVSVAQTAPAAHKKIELFELPEWHDEPAAAQPVQTADAR